MSPPWSLYWHGSVLAAKEKDVRRGQATSKTAAGSREVNRTSSAARFLMTAAKALLTSLGYAQMAADRKPQAPRMVEAALLNLEAALKAEGDARIEEARLELKNEGRYPHRIE